MGFRPRGPKPRRICLGLFLPRPSALVNQQWPFAEHSDCRNVSQLLMQPFLNYKLPNG